MKEHVAVLTVQYIHFPKFISLFGIVLTAFSDFSDLVQKLLPLVDNFLMKSVLGVMAPFRSELKRSDKFYMKLQ